MNEDGSWNITLTMNREQAGVVSAALHWFKQDHAKFESQKYKDATIVENAISDLAVKAIDGTAIVDPAFATVIAQWDALLETGKEFHALVENVANELQKQRECDDLASKLMMNVKSIAFRNAMRESEAGAQ